MQEAVERTAAVWKNAWLPFSETFIRDQIDFLPEWDVLKLGFHNLPDGLLRADYAPYPHSSPGNAVRLLLGVRPFLRSYVEWLERSRSSVIHAHFGSGGVNTLPLARATGLPLITTFHGADTSFYGSKVPGSERRYQSGLRELFDRGTVLLAASRYLADRLIASGAPAAKIEVLYTGSNAIELVQTGEERSGIVFVGRLIPIKGVAHLLQAVSSMEEPLARNTPVTIIGDGPLRTELELLARRLDVNATFLGRVPSLEIPSILASHQVFCGPSLPSTRNTREGFGMVYLEAALQELPVVAYSSGGVVEAVADGQTGILVPEGDIQALSKALSSILRDKTLRTELGIAARRRARRDFDLTTQMSRLADLYRSVST
jgi:colanic acid/amylovoran biosynthesis glycosyltransferase